MFYCNLHNQDGEFSQHKTDSTQHGYLTFFWRGGGGQSSNDGMVFISILGFLSCIPSSCECV